MNPPALPMLHSEKQHRKVTAVSPGPTWLLSLARRDRRLAEQVALALFATGYPALRNLEVVVGDRLVLLRGRVPSYYLKQLAQAAALAVPEVHQLCNQLEVTGSR